MGTLNATGLYVGGAPVVLLNGAGGTPSSLTLTNATGLPIAGLTGLGTGVATALATAVTGSGGIVLATSPTLSGTVGGNITLSGNDTSSGSTLTFSALSAGTQTVCLGLTSGHVLVTSSGACGGSISLTAATPNLTFTPSPITGTGTIGTTVTANVQSGASYTIAASDNTKLIEMTNIAATTVTLPPTGTTGFGSGFATDLVGTVAGTTVSLSSGTIGNLTSVSLAAGQYAGIVTNGAGTNYDMALGMPTSGTQNQVIATPNAATGQPKLRALVGGDIPAISLASAGNGGVTGILPGANGGTGVANTGFTFTLGNSLTFGSLTTTNDLLAVTSSGHVGQIALGTGLSLSGSTLNASAIGTTYVHLTASSNISPTVANCGSFYTDAGSSTINLPQTSTLTSSCLFGFQGAGVGTVVNIHAGDLLDGLSTASITPGVNNYWLGTDAAGNWTTIIGPPFNTVAGGSAGLVGVLAGGTGKQNLHKQRPDLQYRVPGFASVQGGDGTR